VKSFVPLIKNADERLQLIKIEKSMKIKELIEGLLILFISFICLAESLRLIRGLDPKKISDVLGPGYYIFSLGVFLMMIGLTYLFMHYREALRMKKGSSTQELTLRKMNMKVVHMVLVFVIYILLTHTVGYFASTLLFFFLEFRLAGVRSWKSNVLLTSIVTVVFYLVFIHYCQIVFPRGILLEKMDVP
jgi:hypothetical protein